MDRALEQFHPLIAQWFSWRVGTPTPVQAAAWPAIARGEHVLATAPTGSGKTLTAFLWALNQLASGAWEAGTTRVLYVSPLKALNNDIRENLLAPLEGIREAFAAEGVELPEIRVLTRSGDTPQDERRRMIRRPPEILITTPESLNLILSARGSRPMLEGVRTVILDEIHAVAGTKRGAHLMSAVERVTLLAGEFQRVALSATVRPLETVAAMVGGYEVDRGAWIVDREEHRLHHQEARGYAPPTVDRAPVARAVRIVEAGDAKRIEVEVRATPPFRGETPESQWKPLVTDLARRIAGNRSTLIFANNRRFTEKLSLMLNTEVEGLRVYAHHGSLSRETRTVVEKRLKSGELDAIVATNSLELGIDIGDLDEVLIVQTPFSVASALQRIGRAGHQVGATSRAAIYPIYERDYLEAANVAMAVLERDIEPLRPVENPLDLLAQVIVSMTAMERWNLDELYGFVRCIYNFRDLPRAYFDSVIDMLAGRYGESRLRELSPMIVIDSSDNTAEARAHALHALYRGGGTIADRGYFTLRRNDSGAKIGELDEEFVWERSVGDGFTLGSQAWRIERITHNDVFVVPGSPNTAFVPFWRADEQYRRHHLSERVAKFCEEAEGLLKRGGLREELLRNYAMTPEAAEELVAFLQRQREETRAALPHRHHLVVEDAAQLDATAESRQIILHTLWGGALNFPFGLAIAQAWEEKYGQRLEVYSNNDAIAILLPGTGRGEEILQLVDAENVESLLRKRLEQSGYFGARFRENAAIALLLTKDQHGKRTPLWLNRMRAKKLLESVHDLENFPLIVETWRTCLQDEFEMPQLKALLRELGRGVIQVTYTRTSAPSPFAGELVWRETNKYMYLDDTPERGVAGRMTDEFWKELLRQSELRPRIDPGLVARFEAKAQRTAPGYAPTNAQELLHWLGERMLLREEEWENLLDAATRDAGEDARAWLKELEGRIVTLGEEGGARRWVAHVDAARVVRAMLSEEPREYARPTEDWLGEWLRYWGPVSNSRLRELLPFETETITRAVEVLADEGAVIPDLLTRDAAEGEVCDAENLEILLRLTRAAARPVFEARPLEELPLFLAAHQGLVGERSAQEALQGAVEGLFGWCAPADAWEQFLLPARVREYQPGLLDALAQETELSWWGCGKERVTLGFQEQRGLTLGVEDEAEVEVRAEVAALLPDPHARYTLGDLLARSGRSSGEVTKLLWRAAWEGLVTNDSFAALRQGIRTKFRALESSPGLHASTRRGFARWRGTRPFVGHWHRLPEVERPEDALDALELEKDRVRVLLDRYGVLFRELLLQEAPPLRWGAVFRALRLMELSGEIVAGNFFQGPLGLQFTTPSTLARLEAGMPKGHAFWVNATDPASLCGVPLPELKGRLPRRVAGNWLLYMGTRLALTVERQGKGMHFHVGADDPAWEGAKEVLRSLLEQVRGGRSYVAVETINGEAARGSEYLGLLREVARVELEPAAVAVWPRQ